MFTKCVVDKMIIKFFLIYLSGVYIGTHFLWALGLLFYPFYLRHVASEKRWIWFCIIPRLYIFDLIGIEFKRYTSTLVKSYLVYHHFGLYLFDIRAFPCPRVMPYTTIENSYKLWSIANLASILENRTCRWKF